MTLTTFKPTEHPLKRTLTGIIVTHDADRPRSLQTSIGPSGAGEPCTRKLAYMLHAWPSSGGSSSDPLPAIIGTAAHSWMAEALLADNIRSGETRWLVEQTLPIRPPLVPQGSADAYYVPSATVIDWKFPGATKFKEYTKYGPGDVYRKQAHLYGYGYQELGFPVTEVAIVFLPRAGRLSGMHVWAEPYDRNVALETLERVEQVHSLSETLDVTNHPERYQEIPKTPGDACRYCSWLQPGPDTGMTCPGDLG